MQIRTPQCLYLTVKIKGMRDIAVFGAGGYGSEVACLIQKINSRGPQWNFIGFFDDNEKLYGKKLQYGKVLGSIHELNNWPGPLSLIFAIAEPLTLKKVVSKVLNKNIHYPNLLDPDISYLDFQSLKIGHGNIVGYACRFSCNVNIGNFNIIVNDTTMGHDVQVGDFNVFLPETRLSGMVKVGNLNFFGMRTAVLQGLTVGNSTRIAAGSFVMRDTQDDFLYSGNPAKKLRL